MFPNLRGVFIGKKPEFERVLYSRYYSRGPNFCSFCDQ